MSYHHLFDQATAYITQLNKEEAFKNSDNSYMSTHTLPSELTRAYYPVRAVFLSLDHNADLKVRFAYWNKAT